MTETNNHKILFLSDNSRSLDLITTREAEISVQNSIENYRYQIKPFREYPLSQREPEVFNLFMEFYRSLIPLSKELRYQEIQTQVRTALIPQLDALLMVRIAPYDFIEMHNRSLRSLKFVGVENEKFRKLSSIVLHEIISYLYYAYSG